MTSATQPDYIYVTDNPDSIGSGTSSDPYGFFILALAVAWKKYTTVLLVGPTIPVTSTNPKFPRNSVEFAFRDPSDPLNNKSFKRLTIRSLLCSEENLSGCSGSGTTVNFMEEIKMFIGGEILWKNLVLSGAGFFKGPVVYCPDVTNQFDDRGQPATVDAQDASLICGKPGDPPTSYTVFQVKDTGSLLLEVSIRQDVDVVDFASQPLALVQIENGDVSLTRVRFARNTMMRKAKGGVFYQVGPCRSCGSFSFTSGSVTYLNNGYEYSPDSFFSPFLSIEYISSISITDVEFAYNTVLSGEDTTNQSSSLLLVANTPSFQLKSCNFHHNLSRSPLIYVKSSISLAVSDLNEVHISLNAVVFQYNFSISDLFRVSTLADVLNIRISDCQFYRNSIMSGSLVTVDHTGKLLIEDVMGGTKNILVDPTAKTKQKYQIAKKFLALNGLKFTENKSYQSLISLSTYPNVDVSDITVSNCGDNQSLKSSTVIDGYMSDSVTYMSIQPDFGPDLLCSGSLQVQSCTNLTLKNVNFSLISCSKGSAGITISSTDGNLTVSSLTATNNSSKGTIGTVISTTGDVNMTITLATVSNNKSDTGSAMRFAGSTKLTISDSTFQANSGDTGGGLYFDSGTSVTIQRVVFLQNSCGSGTGGALWFHSAAGPSLLLSITDSTFTSNSAADAGAIYISASKSDLLSLQVIRCSFTTNSGSASAAAVLVDSSVRFSSAMVSHCGFTENSSAGGTVYAKFTAGTMTVQDCTFERNNGKYVSAMQIATETGAGVALVRVIFSNNTGGPVLLKPDSRKTSRIDTVGCTFSTANSACLSMEGGIWTDSSSHFTDCHNSAISIISGGSAIAAHTFFTSNISSSNGGAVYIGSGSTFQCSDCQFVGNTATASGGGVFFEQESLVVITGSNFERNTAGAQGSAVFQTSTTRQSSIQSSSFRLNSASFDGTISSISSLLVLDSISLTDNTAAKCPGVSLLLSTLSIRNGKFGSQAGSTAAFVSMVTASTVNVTDSSFSSGSSSTSGAIYCVGSSITIQRTSFLHLKGDQSGLIFAANDSILRFSLISISSVVAKSQSGVMYISQSSIYIERSTVWDYIGGGVVGSQVVTVRLSNVSFGNGQSDLGTAVYCESCSDVAIEGCQFSNLTAKYGGAVYIDNSNVGKRSVFIGNSEFGNNTATVGGAVYVSNTDLVVSGGRFDGNGAREGGAMYLECGAGGCNFTLGSTILSRNTASQRGGGLSWTRSQPTLTNVSFSQNLALYGANISSFPIQMRLLSISHSPARLQTTDTPSLTTPPGQPFGSTLTAALMDHYGQIVTVDSLSTAELVPDNPTAASISGVAKVTANGGVFVFEAFMIYADPNSTTGVRITTDGIPVEDQTYQPDVALTFRMRDCVPGESRTLKSCFVCETGTYNFNPDLPCQTCPRNAQCPGNMTILPDFGYWRASLFSSNIMLCPNAGACLGGGNNSLTGACAQGYAGNLCQSCEDGYSHSSKNVCSKCPDLSINITRLALIALAAFVVISVLVWSALRSANRPAAVHSIYLKILMNYLQLVLLTADFKLNWPDPVLQLFDAQQTVGGVTEQAFSIDCFLAGDKSASDSYYRKMMFVAVLPVGLVLGAAGVWGMVAAYRRSGDVLRRELAATIVIVFFLIHPNLVKMLFSMFSCTDVDGTFWLTVDMAIRCWDDTHLTNIFSTGLPAIILWVFGVPTVCLGVLIKFRQRHDEIWLRLQYGFLINGYRRNQYYWEFVVLYRKIIIICCAVFLGGTIPVQALTVQGVLLVALFLQYDTNPYTTPQLNLMELRAVIVADVTIYCGLYYLTDSLSPGSSWFFFIAIVVSNAFFLLYWLACMSSYLLHLFALNISWVGHCLKPEIYEKDEEVEKMVEFMEEGWKGRPDVGQKEVKGMYLRLLKSHLSVPLSSIPNVAFPRQSHERQQTDAESLFEKHLKTSAVDEPGNNTSFSFQQDPSFDDFQTANP